MLARIRKAMDNKDEGFTLIELLVVIIIIGILAAIAIPVFLNQRKKGYDASVKSDLRNAATAEETYLTDNGYYTPSTAALTATTVGFKQSAASNYSTSAQTITYTLYQADGTTHSAVATDAVGGYCMTATSASNNTWVYNSLAGGLQPKTVTTCP